MKFLKVYRLLCLLIILTKHTAIAQVTASFWVRGDLDKFYPVTFFDGGWHNKVATDLELGRSSAHDDASWRGSVIAKFRYHVTSWGNGSNFIDADIRQFNTTTSNNRFIAGWRDASGGNSGLNIVVWLRGNTSYTYRSNFAVNPVMYDDVQNPLPFQEPGGPTHTYRTSVDNTINPNGSTYSGAVYLTSAGNNYIKGQLGIGTLEPGTYKLAVEGTIGARKVKVTQQTTWADFVFQDDYELRTLPDLEKHIQQYKHLPDIPSAKEVQQNGIDLGEMNAKLLQKVEELSLYIIELNKKNIALEQRMSAMESKK